MKKLLLSGAYSPIPTPFDARGAVAHDKLAENIVKWSKTSLSGLLVLGSNGEFTYLNYEEKLKVLKTARQAIPKDKLFIAGAGLAWLLRWATAFAPGPAGQGSVSHITRNTD